MFEKRIPPGLFPYRQPAPGVRTDPYPWGAYQKWGRISPQVINEQAAMHGRVLAGADNVDDRYAEFRGEDMQDWALDPTKNIYELEELDDTLGSGIFDPARRPGTANVDTGVFESHGSLPGYLARETPFRVNRDVTTLPSGAPYLPVPAGGMAYLEAYGKPVPPEGINQPPAPRRDWRIAPPTGRMQPYAYLTEPQSQANQELISPLRDLSKDVRSQPVSNQQQLPTSYYRAPLAKGQLPLRANYRTRQLPGRPARSLVPLSPAVQNVPTQATFAPIVRKAPIGAVELTEDKKKLLVFAAVGLALGAGAAILFG